MKPSSTLAAAAAVLGAVALAAPASAQQTFTLKFADFAPAGGAQSKMFEAWKKELAEKSQGRLQIEMFYGASMGPLPRHYDLARTGVADLSFYQHGATPGRFPMTELTHIPYMFPPDAKGAEVGARATNELFDQFLVKEHEDARTLVVVFNQPSALYDNRPIRTIADINGRRYRAPTSAVVEILRELGGIPIGMPAPLMAESLQKRTIDGVITDPQGIFTFKLGNLVTHYTPIFVSVISFGVAMNHDSYRQLPADLRALIDGISGTDSAVRMAQTVWGPLPDVDDYITKVSGIATVPFDADEDKRLRGFAERYAESRIADLEGKGMPARAFHDALRQRVAKYSGS